MSYSFEETKPTGTIVKMHIGDETPLGKITKLFATWRDQYIPIDPTQTTTIKKKDALVRNEADTFFLSNNGNTLQLSDGFTDKVHTPVFVVQIGDKYYSEFVFYNKLYDKSKSSTSSDSSIGSQPLDLSKQVDTKLSTSEMEKQFSDFLLIQRPSYYYMSIQADGVIVNF